VNTLLDAAMGPLLRATALFLILGLLREAVIRLVPARSAGVLVSGSGTVTVTSGTPLGLRFVATWLGVAAVLLLAFARDHLAVLTGSVPASPALLGPRPAEWIGLVLLGGLLFGLCHRAWRRRKADAPSWSGLDTVLSLLALALAFGVLARHPEITPMPYRSALLVHVLAAEAFFVSVPIVLARRREVSR
jgi:hypothetical protein